MTRQDIVGNQALLEAQAKAAQARLDWINRVFNDLGKKGLADIGSGMRMARR